MLLVMTLKIIFRKKLSLFLCNVLFSNAFDNRLIPIKKNNHFTLDDVNISSFLKLGPTNRQTNI